MENFLDSVFIHLGIITIVLFVAIVYLIVWLILTKGRTVIRINKMTISNDLLNEGFTEEILIKRLKNCLYDSVHNFHVREKKEKWSYLHMPFKQVFSLSSNKTTFEISSTSDFWRPVLVVINWVFYRINSVTYELSFQKIDETKFTHSYNIYSNAKLIKQGSFDVERELKTSFCHLISDISSFLVAQVCPPCYLQSIEILRSNTNSLSKDSIIALDTLIAQIINKLLLGSMDYCCVECKGKLNSSKFLKKCNRMHGYLMTPISVKFLHLLDMLDNKKESLSENDNFYLQLRYMKSAFEAFEQSKSFLFKRIYKNRFENRRKWLCFFEGRIRHTWFENMFFKEIEFLQDGLLGVTKKKYDYDSFRFKFDKKYNANLISYEEGLGGTTHYDGNSKSKKKVKFHPFSKDKKHKAYFLHNIADLYFRNGIIGDSCECILENIRLANKFNSKIIDSLLDYSYFSFRFTGLNGNDSVRKQIDDKYPYGYLFHNDGLQVLQKYLQLKNSSRSIEAQILLYVIQFGCVLRSGEKPPNILKNQQDLSIHPLLICIDNLKVLMIKLECSFNLKEKVEVQHLLWLATFLKTILGINRGKESFDEIANCYKSTIDVCNDLRDESMKKWMKSIIINNNAVLNWHYYKERDPNYDGNGEQLMVEGCNLVQINPYINENAKKMKVQSKLLLGVKVDSHIDKQMEFFNVFRIQSYMPILHIENYRSDRAISRNDHEKYSVAEVFI